MKNVTIYSTPNCTWCNKAKEYFKANDVAYTEYNVAEDPAKSAEMKDKSGQLGVPVIVIDEKVIIGFDEPEIASSLGLGSSEPMQMAA